MSEKYSPKSFDEGDKDYRQHLDMQYRDELLDGAEPGTQRYEEAKAYDEHLKAMGERQDGQQDYEDILNQKAELGPDAIDRAIEADEEAKTLNDLAIKIAKLGEKGISAESLIDKLYRGVYEYEKGAETLDSLLKDVNQGGDSMRQDVIGRILERADNKYAELQGVETDEKLKSPELSDSRLLELGRRFTREDVDKLFDFLTEKDPDFAATFSDTEVEKDDQLRSLRRAIELGYELPTEVSSVDKDPDVSAASEKSDNDGDKNDSDVTDGKKGDGDGDDEPQRKPQTNLDGSVTSPADTNETAQLPRVAPTDEEYLSQQFLAREQPVETLDDMERYDDRSAAQNERAGVLGTAHAAYESLKEKIANWSKDVKDMERGKKKKLLVAVFGATALAGIAATAAWLNSRGIDTSMPSGGEGVDPTSAPGVTVEAPDAEALAPRALENITVGYGEGIYDLLAKNGIDKSTVPYSELYELQKQFPTELYLEQAGDVMDVRIANPGNLSQPLVDALAKLAQ